MRWKIAFEAHAGASKLRLFWTQTCLVFDLVPILDLHCPVQS